MWKAFYFWKRWIQQNKANKHRRFLQENLYFANDTLCNALLDLRELCYEVWKSIDFDVFFCACPFFLGVGGGGGGMSYSVQLQLCVVHAFIHWMDVHSFLSFRKFILVLISCRPLVGVCLRLTHETHSRSVWTFFLKILFCFVCALLFLLWLFGLMDFNWISMCVRFG